MCCRFSYRVEGERAKSHLFLQVICPLRHTKLTRLLLSLYHPTPAFSSLPPSLGCCVRSPELLNVDESSAGEHEVLTVQDSSSDDNGDNGGDENDDETVPFSRTTGSGNRPHKRQRQKGGEDGLSWGERQLSVSGWSVGYFRWSSKKGTPFRVFRNAGLLLGAAKYCNVFTVVLNVNVMWPTHILMPEHSPHPPTPHQQTKPKPSNPPHGSLLDFVGEAVMIGTRVVVGSCRMTTSLKGDMTITLKG